MDSKKSALGHTQKRSEINGLSPKSRVLVTPSKSPQIDLFHVEKQKVIDGVEMGVLDNGTPYLSESGLARMCGIDRTAPDRTFPLRICANFGSVRDHPNFSLRAAIDPCVLISISSLTLRVSDTGCIQSIGKPKANRWNSPLVIDNI